MALLTAGEVGKILRISTQTVRRLIDDGEIVGYSVGHQRRVDAEELRRYLNRQSTSKSTAENQPAV